jgi:hypothetical protein
VLLSNTSINAFDGADPANAEYLAVVAAGELAKAAAIRARHPARWRVMNDIANHLGRRAAVTGNYAAYFSIA